MERIERDLIFIRSTVSSHSLRAQGGVMGSFGNQSGVIDGLRHQESKHPKQSVR